MRPASIAAARCRLPICQESSARWAASRARMSWSSSGAATISIWRPSSSTSRSPWASVIGSGRSTSTLFSSTDPSARSIARRRRCRSSCARTALPATAPDEVPAGTTETARGNFVKSVLRESFIGLPLLSKGSCAHQGRLESPLALISVSSHVGEISRGEQPEEPGTEGASFSMTVQSNFASPYTKQANKENTAAPSAAPPPVHRSGVRRRRAPRRFRDRRRCRVSLC